MERRGFFGWFGFATIAAGTLLIPGHGSLTELETALQSPIASSFTGEVDKTRYTEIYHAIKSLGIPILDQNSGYVSGATRLVINFAEKEHGLSAERTRELAMLDLLLEHIGIGAIGVEKEVGPIESSQLAHITGAVHDYEALWEELHGPENRISGPLVAHYNTIAKIIPDVDSRIIHALNNLIRGSVNITLYRQEQRTMGTYILSLFGRKPLFGLEDPQKLALAENYSQGAYLYNSLIECKLGMDMLNQLARENSQNAEFQIAYQGIYNTYRTLADEVACYRSLVEPQGFAYFNQKGLVRTLLELRNPVWAQKVDAQDTPIVLTITGKDHIPGFTRALQEKKMSVINIDTPSHN